MRLLEKLREYDDSVTVGQLITKLKGEQELAEQEELELENYVKSEFESTYLKFIDEDSIYGRELNVIELKNFVRKERTEDWDFIYYFEGNKIKLSDRALYHREFNTKRCGDSFSLKDLINMSKITKEEYLKYKWEFEDIKKQLTNLLY